MGAEGKATTRKPSGTCSLAKENQIQTGKIFPRLPLATFGTATSLALSCQAMSATVKRMCSAWGWLGVDRADDCFSGISLAQQIAQLDKPAPGLSDKENLGPFAKL